MDGIDTLGLLAQLEEEFCELNHGPDTGHEHHPAVDYIIQPFGYSVNEVEDFTTREMVVPVCGACAEALHGNEWTLLYCFECNSSQWVARNLASNQYRHNVLWLRGCPHCSEKFGGLYFSDFKAVVENSLLSSMLSLAKRA